MGVKLKTWKWASYIGPRWLYEQARMINVLKIYDTNPSLVWEREREREIYVYD